MNENQDVRNEEDSLVIKYQEYTAKMRAISDARRKFRQSINQLSSLMQQGNSAAENNQTAYSYMDAKFAGNRSRP